MKIKLTTETKISITGETLYRIEALEDIPARGVKKGDKGGFISTLEVRGNARVDDNAWVSGNAEVYGNARVCGNAWVSGNAQVYGDAWVYDNAWVYGDARVYGNSRVYGDAWVYGDARVLNNAQIDSSSAIIVLIIACHYSVTITRNLVFAGCQTLTRKKALNLSKKSFIEMGGMADYYLAYKEMVKGALKIVKEKP